MIEKALAVARLLRLSNAPTAVADVLAGWSVAHGALTPSWSLAGLGLASLAFYHGGMALNDAVDAPDDASLPRPIPQGLIARNAAYGMAYGLLTLGVLAACGVAWRHGATLPVIVAVGLAASVVAYNSRLKRTPLGPVLMGTCRSLNLLLGASLALDVGAGLLLAPGALAYVAGLTWFARDEHQGGHQGGGRSGLAGGAVVALVGLAWFAVCPMLGLAPAPRAAWNAWVLLWDVTTLYVFRGVVAALLQPTPANIGRGVGLGIQGIVLIDAALAVGYAGPVAGFAVLGLLPVTLLLARWIPQT